MTKVIQYVAETEVFVNESGSISILQTDWPNEPALIVIPVQFVDVIVDALRNAKEEAIG